MKLTLLSHLCIGITQGRKLGSLLKFNSYFHTKKEITKTNMFEQLFIDLAVFEYV